MQSLKKILRFPNRLALIGLGSLVISLAPAGLAYASPAPAGGSGSHHTSTQSCTTTSCDFIGKYVNPAINLLSVVFGLLAAASIIMGGIQYSTSGGDSQKVTQAKQRISKTIVGILAYLFLYAFLQFLVPGGVF